MELPFSLSNNSDDLCPSALHYPEVADPIATHEFNCNNNST